MQILPTPFRWLGMELVRFVHWLDHRAGRAVVVFRNSPIWFFVTLVGMLSIGLTILLFISLIGPTSGHHSQLVHRQATAHAGRDQLERAHDWSAQDRWRIAHLFVPNKPVSQPRNIQLDSRLMASDANAEYLNPSKRSASRRTHRDIDVRLELNRPQKAQQGQRFVGETTIDAGSRIGQRPKTRIRSRDPRLLVQATWEFGSECNQSEYVGLPIRRATPVPSPPDEPITRMIPIRKLMPDLFFEMEMIRHSTASGHYPPGSRTVSLSDRSVFPVDAFRSHNGLVSYDGSDWKRSSSIRHRNGEEVIPYPGSGDSPSEALLTSDEFDPSLPAMTEVNLRVELVAPHSVSTGRSHHSKLFVSNNGQEIIPRVEVNDSIGRLKTVVAADPAATIETMIDPETGAEDTLLHREVERMSPGDEREFVLQWIPNDGHRQLHRAWVIAHAAVATMTEVNRPTDPDLQVASTLSEPPAEKHPALACDIQYLESVFVGDDVELEITVRNTGDTTLHNVQVTIEVPNQLSHRDGRNVIFEAGTLDVSGRNQTVLKLSAKQAGDAINLLQVAAVEQVVARGRARIVVVERGKEPATLPPLPETMRSKPLTNPPAVIKPTPVPSQPVGNCCCQQLSMMWIEPEYQFP